VHRLRQSSFANYGEDTQSQDSTVAALSSSRHVSQEARVVALLDDLIVGSIDRSRQGDGLWKIGEDGYGDEAEDDQDYYYFLHRAWHTSRRDRKFISRI
jgi:hypothetical protein